MEDKDVIESIRELPGEFKPDIVVWFGSKRKLNKLRRKYAKKNIMKADEGFGVRDIFSADTGFG